MSEKKGIDNDINLQAVEAAEKLFDAIANGDGEVDDILDYQQRCAMRESVAKDQEIKRALLEQMEHVDLFERRDRLFEAMDLSRPNAKSRWARLNIGRVASIAAMVVLALVILSPTIVRDKPQEVTHIAYRQKEMQISKPTFIIDKDTIEVGEEHQQAELSQLQVATLDKPQVVSTPVRLITPAQQSQSVVLPDGSSVVLNASSELHFPSTFDGEMREVTLIGEAYFTVEKSDKPFIVNANGSRVRVYGTEFNVNTHYGELTSTVLVEGSVAIEAGEVITPLVPNQMAVVSHADDRVEVQEVNVGRYIAWVDGYFEFIDCDFALILHELNQWYGAEFAYVEDEFEGVELTLSFKRNVSAHDALTKIDKAIDISINKNSDQIYEIRRRL